MDNSDVSEGIFETTSCSPTVLLCTFIIFFVFLLVTYRYSNNSKKSDSRKRRNGTIHFRQLPSPIGFPVVGHLLRMGSLPHLALTKWTKEFGSMYRIKMGFQEVLVISGTENIKKALLKSNAFAGRPNLETSKLISEGFSLTFSDYSPIWDHQKMAAKAAVSLYTTGKDPSKRSVMESSSYEHANHLVDGLLEKAKQQDGALNPRDTVLTHASSAICQVCFGQNFNSNDPKLLQLLAINRNFDEAMAASQPVNFWPFLQHFPIVAKSFKKLKVYSGKYWTFITSMLQSHWKTYDDEYMRDLVDCLYNESEKERRNNNEIPIVVQNGMSKNPINKGAYCNGYGTRHGQGTPNGNGQVSSENGSHYERSSYPGTVFDPMCVEDKETEQELKKRITYTIGDIFGAGYDTLFSLIHWFFLYMAVYPDTQTKMREEIDRVIRPDDAPSYRLHSSKCPYVMAWLYEMMRHCSPSPMLLPHRTTQQVEFNNCIIPAGVTVYFNAWQAHRDPEKWSNPEEFNPERFLIEKEDGSLGIKSDSTVNLFTWGAGKRRCLGYQLSRHQLFIFLCTIVRRLDVKPYQSGIEPCMPWPVHFGLALKPHPFRIRVSERPDAY